MSQYVLSVTPPTQHNITVNRTEYVVTVRADSCDNTLTGELSSVRSMNLAVTCPTLSDPANGRVNSTGENTMYSCDVGFELDGNYVLNCLPTALWDLGVRGQLAKTK